MDRATAVPKNGCEKHCGHASIEVILGTMGPAIVQAVVTAGDAVIVGDDAARGQAVDDECAHVNSLGTVGDITRELALFTQISIQLGVYIF
jgi:hypothetical protein